MPLHAFIGPKTLSNAPPPPPNFSRVTILRGWCRGQKPLNPENTKKYEKNTKSPTPGWPPKIRKNYQKKIRKRPKNYHFCIFSVIFSYFWGPLWGWGILYFFSVIFSYFRGIQGFSASVPPPQDRNSRATCHQISRRMSASGNHHAMRSWPVANDVSGQVRPRQGTEICNFGAPSPLQGKTKGQQLKGKIVS